MAQQSYLSPVWRRWKLCLLLPAVLGGAVYFACGFLPKWYEGESTVHVATIVYNSGTIGLSGTTSRDLLACFTTEEVLEKVGAKLRLAEDHGIDLPAEGESLVTASSPRGTNHVVVSVRMPTPSLAQQVATEVAKEGVAYYLQLMRQEYDAIVSKLKTGAEDTRTALGEIEAQIEKFQKEHRLETLSQRVAVYRTMRVDIEKHLLELRADETTQRAKIAAYEKEIHNEDLAKQVEKILADSPPLKASLSALAKASEALETFRRTSQVDALADEVNVERELRAQRRKDRAKILAEQAALKEKVRSLTESLAGEKPTIELVRKLVRDPAYQQVMAKLTGKAVEELLALSMSESGVNAVYVSLRGMLETARAEARHADGMLAALDAAAAAGDAKLTEMESQLLGLERQKADLVLREEIASQRAKHAAEALYQDRGVATPVYMVAVQALVTAKARLASVRAELSVLESTAQESQKALTTKEDELFTAQTMFNEKQSSLKHAQDAADRAATTLQAARNVPAWPPMSLSVTPAARPVSPVAPSRTRIATMAFAALAALLSLAVIYRDRRKAGPKAAESPAPAGGA